MVEAVGGEEKFIEIFQENLKKVKETMDLSISVEPVTITKTGTGKAEGLFVIPQKQEGLYAYLYHPQGGCPSVDVLRALQEVIADMQDVELRLSPDESCYIINLTADEVEKVKAVLSDNATTVFETSVSCIGASTCQVGLRDSQALLAACIKAVKENDIAADALPQMHVSGCPSSCGTHQIGSMGFRGHIKMVDKKPVSAFQLFIGGNDYQGNETMGREAGIIAETDIPSFVVELGKTVTASHLSFDAWVKENPDGIVAIAEKYF